MTSYLALTVNQVKETISTVKRSKPAYSELLEFYGALFYMQEESKIRVQLDPIHISKKLRFRQSVQTKFRGDQRRRL